MISVLDETQDGNCPEACSVCRSTLWCICPETIAAIRASPDFVPFPPIIREPAPPPPAMVEILMRRMSREEAEAPTAQAREEVLRRRHNAPVPVAASSALVPLAASALVPPAASAKTQPQAASTASLTNTSAGSTGCFGQKNWEAVEKLLPPRTLRLERTFLMFEELLSDLHMQVCLPSDTFYIQHCKRVVATIPKDHRFKIGITVCPNYRYYEPHYAYSKPRAQERDRVRYCNMVVVFTHHSRDTIAMLEHTFIHHCHTFLPRQCANKKLDYDDQHTRRGDDESGSSDEPNSAGPHSLYICHGKAM